MPARKPKIEYYWTNPQVDRGGERVVNWRLIGANGEVMCHSNQGFRDKTDAQRSVDAVLCALIGVAFTNHSCREVGPGRKPA